MSHRLRAAIVLAAAALTACAPDATEPSGIISTGGPQLTLLDPPVVVDVLQRSEPLLQQFAAVGLIGRGGGTIRLPQAGFTITFPPNSVLLPTPVTVVAVPGTAVAYLFQPHGLVFRQPPVITQDLRGTQAFADPSLLSGLEGVYFSELSALDGLTALVRESRPTTVNVNTWTLRFDVKHFSGYAVSARRGGYINASGNFIPFGR